MTERLQFRPMNPDDLPLMHEWLQREHIRHWWSEHETYQEVRDHYLPAIDGCKPTDLFVVEVDERPVGFIQTYLLSDYPAHATQLDLGEGVAGIDLFIAEEELTGKGLGADVLRAFTDRVVFARPATFACVADPDARNAASIRAFEKAGFVRIRDYFDPSDGATHTLVRLDRAV